MNIQNLKESISDVAARGELKGIRSVDGDIESIIIEMLEERGARKWF